MVKKIICIVWTIALVGCACDPIYVKVPPKEPPVIERPALATDNIKPDDDDGTVIQLHRITIKTLQKWGLELEAALDAYRIKKEVK